MNTWNPLAYGRFYAEKNRPSIDLLARDTARAAPPHRGPWLRRRPLDAGARRPLPRQRSRRRRYVHANAGCGARSVAGRAFPRGLRGQLHRTRRPRLRKCAVSLGSGPYRRHDAHGRRSRARRMPGGADARQRGRTHARSDAERSARRYLFAQSSRGRARRERKLAHWAITMRPFRPSAISSWTSGERSICIGSRVPRRSSGLGLEGAGLRPYLALLAADEREEYLNRYLEAITAAYPRQAWGGVLMPFPRLFVVVRRA